jgi:hypothetical protein
MRTLASPGVLRRAEGAWNTIAFNVRKEKGRNRTQHQRRREIEVEPAHATAVELRPLHETVDHPDVLIDAAGQQRSLAPSFVFRVVLNSRRVATHGAKPAKGGPMTS